MRLIADQAGDSDKRRAKPGPKEIRLLAPYRRNRQQAQKQSPEVGERYRHRWKIARTSPCWPISAGG
jgi:hypothetical protein